MLELGVKREQLTKQGEWIKVKEGRSKKVVSPKSIDVKIGLVF